MQQSAKFDRWAAFPTNQNGDEIVHKHLLIASALCALAATAQAQTAPSGKTEARTPPSRSDLVKTLDESFARVDANKDGTISRDEIQTVEAKAEQQATVNLQKQLEQEFARLDGDKNGQLSLTEFKSGASVRSNIDSNAAVQRLDTNKDGKISPVEFKARALASFDRVDANKDGRITAEEQRKVATR